MFKYVVLCTVMAVASGIGNSADARSQVAPWCAWDPGIQNYICSFYTHQQCMETAWGNGGICLPNSWAEHGDKRQRRRLR